MPGAGAGADAGAGAGAGADADAGAEAGAGAGAGAGADADTGAGAGAWNPEYQITPRSKPMIATATPDQSSPRFTRSTSYQTTRGQLQQVRVLPPLRTPVPPFVLSGAPE